MVYSSKGFGSSTGCFTTDKMVNCLEGFGFSPLLVLLQFLSIMKSKVYHLMETFQLIQIHWFFSLSFLVQSLVKDVSGEQRSDLRKSHNQSGFVLI